MAVDPALLPPRSRSCTRHLCRSTPLAPVDGPERRTRSKEFQPDGEPNGTRCSGRGRCRCTGRGPSHHARRPVERGRQPGSHRRDLCREARPGCHAHACSAAGDHPAERTRLNPPVVGKCSVFSPGLANPSASFSTDPGFAASLLASPPVPAGVDSLTGRPPHATASLVFRLRGPLAPSARSMAERR